MDWNWFFSSLSQSAAAIVGLFGAFIISKTLGNQSTFTQKSSQLETILADCESIEKEADDLSLPWYNDRKSDRALDKLAEKVEEDDSILELDSRVLFDELRFSPYHNRDLALELIETHVKLYRDDIHQYQLHVEAESRQENGLDSLESDTNNPFANFIRTTSLIGRAYQPQSRPEFPNHSPLRSMVANQVYISQMPAIERELERIEAVRRKAQHQINLNTNFLRTVEGDPENSGQVTTTLVLITLLFFIGVIYPVSFMPLAAGQPPSPSLSAVIPTLLSFKGMMLTMVSITFCTIPLIFLRLNNSFKYKKDQITKLIDYCRPQAFSEYFKFYELNVAARVRSTALQTQEDDD